MPKSFCGKYNNKFDMCVLYFLNNDSFFYSEILNRAERLQKSLKRFHSSKVRNKEPEDQVLVRN